MMKTVFFSLLFLTAPFILSAQEAVEDLSFKSGTWSYNYYIGTQQVTFETFIEKLSTGNAPAGNMFKSGKNLSIAGTVIGSVGAFCFGYDLGTRLAGGKGNITLLAGGGGVMAGGILLYYMGEGKMKKALTLYKNDAVSFRLSPSQTGLGLGLCINF